MVLQHWRKVVVAAVLVIAGYTLWNALGWGHSIVNGGEIYSRLTAVRAARPRSATAVRESSTAASWILGCPSIAGSRSGWTSDRVSVSFHDASPAATVIGEINRTLVRQGWRRRDVAPGSHQGKVPHWTLDVHNSGVAQAFAFATPASSQDWNLSAIWNPPGPRGQGCP